MYSTKSLQRFIYFLLSLAGEEIDYKKKSENAFPSQKENGRTSENRQDDKLRFEPVTSIFWGGLVVHWILTRDQYI